MPDQKIDLTVQRVSIPVIGIGGIMNERDALQYIITGAVAVQIGTGLFVNPNAPHSIIKGIENYLRAKGYESVQEIIGCLKTQ